MPILNDVAQLIMGQSPPSSTYNDTGEGLPFYQGKTDFGAIYPLPQKFCTHPKKIALPGDILISVRAPVGTTNLCREKSCIGRGIAVIRPEKINRYYLFYNLRYLEKKIAALGTGSTFKSINKSQLASVIVNNENFLIQEQKIIASVLSLVQNAIAQQEKAIALTTELKKALMQKLFTEGTRNEPQKQTEIGLIPESWDVEQLGKLAKLKSGGTPSRKKAEYWDEGSIPWVKTTEINYQYIEDTEEKITIEGLKNSSAKIFPKGTLLMAMYGQGVTRGRVGILNIDAATNQACVAIIPNSEQDISTKYLYNYFYFNYDYLRQIGHGANQKNLSATILKLFPIAFPDRDIQDRISMILEKIDIKFGQHEQKKQLLLSLFQTLLHQLMTAKIRVSELNLDSLNLELEE